MANRCGHGRMHCMECHAQPSPLSRQPQPNPVEPAVPLAWRIFDGIGGYEYTDDKEMSQAWEKHLGDNYASWLTKLYDHQDSAEILQMKRDLENLRESRIKELGEISNLRAMLSQATDRIKDLLKGDDGQAWKEAEKFMKGLEAPQSSTETVD